MDAIDLAYHAGHAYSGGWELTAPVTGAPEPLTQTLIGKDDPHQLLLGRKRLRWIFVSACGPLQDRCVEPSLTDVFHWVGGVDRLRMIAGFASSISGFTDPGARMFRLARQRVSPCRAWLPAA